MGNGKEITREMVGAINRTNQLVEAARKLKEFRDKIDDILHVINSGEEFHDDLADSCVDVGIRLQGVSKHLRPISIEGKRKNLDKKIKTRWTQKYRLALNAGNHDWVKQYCTFENLSYRSYAKGPNESFIKDFCSDLEQPKKG